METYNNRELINLTELGQYLKSVLEFCILQDKLKRVYEIKWNIQYIDLAVVTDNKEESKEFFLEVVIVLNTLSLLQEDNKSIFKSLNEFFTVEFEQPTTKEINGETFIITKLHDTQRERFTLKSGGKSVPMYLDKYDVTISIESMLRNVSPSAKLILSSDDFQNEERRVIRELIKEKSNIQEKLKLIQLPIIVCEGITDMKIIETAWYKLYPEKEIPFKVIPSGTWLEIDKYKSGGARDLSSLLNLYSTVNPEDKIFIGLFDNDKEGNAQFKGLKPEVFEEYGEFKIIRKHRSQKIYGILLPIPEFRKNYNGKPSQRYFCIEHYFSDEILEKNKMKGDTIAPDSAIFSISGDKNKFSNILTHLDKSTFENMTILFDELLNLIYY
jgi:hypothetical protein